MDILIDQFDDAERTRLKMEGAQRAASESFNSLVNAAAAANGAGLIAIASYLPLQTLGVWLLTTISASGLLFTAGLWLAGAAKLAANHELLMVANGYRNKLQEQNFETHFASHVTEEDRRKIFAGLQQNTNSGLAMQHDSEAKRGRWTARSLVAFVIGFLILASSVIVQKATDLPSSIEKDRCRVLEIDMMRIQPQRENAPELFRSLNCKPQTSKPLEGQVRRALGNPKQRS
jgi:hypothetical protein